VISLVERLLSRASTKSCWLDYAHSEVRNWVRILIFDTRITFWWDENRIRILEHAGQDPVYPKWWIRDQETWRMPSIIVHFCSNELKMERANRNWYSKASSRSFILIEAQNTPKTRFSPKNASFSYWERRPIESNLSATRYYYRKNSLHAVAEMLNTHFCMIWPQSCMFRDMAQSSNFFTRRTTQYYYQKCFSAVFDRFHIARLHRKHFSKKVVGPPWIHPYLASIRIRMPSFSHAMKTLSQTNLVPQM
jgi:hypothetical protein